MRLVILALFIFLFYSPEIAQAKIIDFNSPDDLLDSFSIEGNTSLHLHQEPSGGITGGIITYPTETCRSGCFNNLKFKYFQPLLEEGKTFKASMSVQLSSARPGDRFGGISYASANMSANNSNIRGYGFVVPNAIEWNEFSSTFSNSDEIVWWITGHQSV